MSGRNRARANPNQDADAERRLWKDFCDKAKEVDTMVARSNEIGHEIVQVEEQQAGLLASDKPADGDLDQRLEALYRENVKLCEEAQHILQGNSNDMNILDSLDVLTGLRRASEETAAQIQLSQPPQRAASGKLNRPGKKASRNGAPAAALSTEEAEEISAAPSPRINLTNRLNTKDKSRAGSIPTTRETSVKIEDGAESVGSSADGVSTTAGSVASKVNGGSRASNRIVLVKDEVVFCRHDPKNFDSRKGEVPEGEGILCRVTAVIGEGKQRRYEVQDADNSGDPPPPQRASVSQLIQIPRANKGLSDLSKGKHVLAQYPDTTTFYKAEVSEVWRAREGETVKLNFQDDEQAREVERRFVLTEK